MVLLRTAHPGPAAAVTALSGLLAVAAGGSVAIVALVIAAVGTGQLSIGWSNDLIDAVRDRAVGRTDKPLATGGLSERAVRAACGTALIATIPLSLAGGWVAGTFHLVGMVGGGWAYNLGVKATAWSWLPYATGFGALPVYVVLAADADPQVAWWLPSAGVLLGVGAHFVNVVPDLADDAATGIRGLPHRLGAEWSLRSAAGLLAAASVTIVAGSEGVSVRIASVGLIVVAALVGVIWRGSGRTPFAAAIGIALVDVMLLLIAG